MSGPNRSPAIQSIAVTPDPVPWGGTAVVTVRASDPDGQRITYAYAAGPDRVTVTDERAAVRCTASIQCRDSFGATSSTSWTIEP